MAIPPEPEPARRDVIHDIGYRKYSGARLGESYTWRTLYELGVWHCFGIGRAARYKVLPMMMLAIMMIPALIIVGVQVIVDLDRQVLPYSRYAVIMQLVISIFVAVQAPALIARDLRYRVITLYLARPLRLDTYVYARVASLATGLLVLTGLPLLVLYAGSLLAGLPPGSETRDMLTALAGAAILSVVLACIAGVVSAWTTRRGFAIAAIITTLVMSYSVVATIQGIANEQGNTEVAGYAGLFTPFTLVDGIQVALFNTEASTSEGPPGATGGLVFAAVAVALVAVCLLVLLRRFRKVAGR
ncbi:MAG TPA: ABC transporter permease [Nocardioidaceae bacterium]|nr:ABC transporter permease [Nocardioidaceae bacterium]